MRNGAMVQGGVYIYSASSSLAYAGGARPIGYLMCGNASCGLVMQAQILYTPAELATIAQYWSAIYQAQYAQQSGETQRQIDWARNYSEQLSNNEKMAYGQKLSAQAALKAQLRPWVEAYLEQVGKGNAEGFRQWLTYCANFKENGLQLAASSYGSETKTDAGGGVGTDISVKIGDRLKVILSTDKVTVKFNEGPVGLKFDSDGNLDIKGSYGIAEGAASFSNLLKGDPVLQELSASLGNTTLKLDGINRENFTVNWSLSYDKKLWGFIPLGEIAKYSGTTSYDARVLFMESSGMAGNAMRLYHNQKQATDQAIKDAGG
jgi:hypothetical protein